MHINNHRIEANIGIRVVSPMPKELQQNQRIDKLWNTQIIISDVGTLLQTSVRHKNFVSTRFNHVHPERASRIQWSNTESCAHDLEVLDSVLTDNEKFIQKSRNERRAMDQKDKPVPLYKTGSTKVALKA